MEKLIKSKKRYEHIMEVEKYGMKMAEIWGADKNEVSVACLAHDLFRDLPQNKIFLMCRAYSISYDKYEEHNPNVLHGRLAAVFLKKKFNINKSIFEAVYYHTSGYYKFDTLGKILFVSDALEAGRDYKGITKLRKASFTDLDLCYFFVLKSSLKYALKDNLMLLKDTVKAWNHIAMEVQESGKD
ncbi:MAG TPA: bis(5'-nucleosyl)-tetraphosphatase (symmetrical) YqeK [Petrotogaceae bacterium]|nr:bis(5'-nucleosyl)-tetraphosphatase (symmetrical) YqeK [Petrotogaceae bacterium]HQI77881.1 bis(5'-nucleosyl)-tetraphosphatase (symmetrical) YqeK [Petrotogaceae bacterium]